MVEKYNPNPLGKMVGDCAIRAVSKAIGSDWDKAYVALCSQGYIMKDLPNADNVWTNYLKSYGFERLIIPNTCPDCYTIGDFAADNAQGVYVLGTGRHAVCVKNGIIYDSWDSSREVPIFYMRGTDNGI